MSIIKTKRLVLRPLKKEDAEFIVRYANDKIVYRNTLAIPHPYDSKHAKDWIGKMLKNYKQKNPEEYVFAIEIGNKFAGAIGIHKIINGHKAELGYWLGRKHWGKGIMPEATIAATEFAFKKFNLKRIYAGVFSWNGPSMRVLEKSGFKLEGILKKGVLKEKKYIDEHIWAKVR